MFGWIKNGVLLAIGETILAAILMLLGLTAGCSEGGSMADTLTFLQQGKARGHLVVTSDGQVGGGISTNVYGGAADASVSFDGDIDFADSVRHVSDPAPD